MRSISLKESIEQFLRAHTTVSISSDNLTDALIKVSILGVGDEFRIVDIRNKTRVEIEQQAFKAVFERFKISINHGANQ